MGIGIEKIVGVKIPPPSLLEESNQIGFAERIFDRDGVIRFFTYWAFLQGWWLPIIPIAIALILAAMVIAIVTQRRLATMQLTETVRQLILISQSRSGAFDSSQPTVSKIALELLKQGESTKNRALIERTVNR